MGLLPWRGDVASGGMDVLFGLGVLAQTIVDNGSGGVVVFEGGDQ